MKKIYATLMMLLVSIMAFAQTNITLVCEDYESLSVYAPGEYRYDGSATPISWDAATKSVQVTWSASNWSTAVLKTDSGHLVKAILDKDGDNVMWGDPSSEVQLWASDVDDGETYTVVLGEKLPKVAYIKGDPTEVYVEWLQKEYTADDQVDGQWKIEISDDDYGSIYVYANDGYRITSVYNNTNGKNYLYTPGESAMISIYGLDQCDNFIDVTVVDLAEVRTDKFSFEVVGDLDKVNLVRNGSYNGIKLTEDNTTIYYDPATEVPFSISNAKNSYSYLYKVTQNGEDLPRQGYRFALYPQNGDEVVVYTEFPDVQVPVSFEFTNEDTEGVVTKVTVDNEVVSKEEWSSPDFSVKLGSLLVVYLSDTYQFQLFKNDVSQYVYGTYSEAIVDETPVKLTITAEKLPVYQLTVNIDDPSHIKFNATGHVIDLQEGENIIELSQSYNYIQIQATATGNITSITCDPELPTPIENFNNVYLSNAVKNDMVMTITTEEFVRGNKGIIYLAKGTSESSIANGNGWDNSIFYLGQVSNIPQKQEIELQLGYNQFDWCEQDLPFYLSMWPTPSVYLNDQLVERGTVYPFYDGLNELTNNGVIKIYPEEVEPLTAVLSIEEGVKATLTTDYVNEVAADATTLSVLPGTLCTVALEKEDGKEYYVAVDGIAVEADEDGVYAFSITEDCVVFIATSPAFPTEFNITADSENVEIAQGLDDETYLIMVEGSTYNDDVTLSFERPEGWDGILLVNADQMMGGMNKVPAYWPTVDQIKESLEGMECQQGLEFTLPADGTFHIYMGMLYVNDQVDYEHGFMMLSNVSKEDAPAFPEKLDVTTSVEGLTVSQEPEMFGGIVITVEGECEADELTVTVATPEGWDGFVGHVMADDPNIAPLAEIYWVPVSELLAQGMEKTNALTFAVPDEAALQMGEMYLYIGERADYGRIIELDVNVSKKGAGIDSIAADSLVNQDVYNLQGILVKANASAEDLKALPAGLYIVGGKKVVIR